MIPFIYSSVVLLNSADCWRNENLLTDSQFVLSWKALVLQEV